MITGLPGILQYPTGTIYATWDASKKGSLVSLSGNVATISGSGGTGMVLSTIGKSSGKWYWEITITSATIERASLGISTATGSYNIELGVAPTAYAICRVDVSNQDKANNNTFVNFANSAPYFPRLQSGQVVSIALDMTAGEIRIYKDGLLNGTSYMYNGLSGTFYAAVSRHIVTSSTIVYTANFGATAFSSGTLAVRTALALSGYNIGLFS